MTKNIIKTATEPSIEEIPLGAYGTAWLNWMEDNHKKKVREMKSKGIFLTVARSVDKSAWDYRKILDRDYEYMHPRPCGEDELRKWEFTRAYYSDSAVMRERVLEPYTTP
jgi:hypothetical protein